MTNSSNDNGQSDAERIVELTRRADPINTLIDETKKELRKHEGQTFTTEDGSTVTVSRATKDRPNGIEVKLDEEAFNALTDEQRSILFESGVIKTVSKITKGGAARVAVKLSK